MNFFRVPHVDKIYFRMISKIRSSVRFDNHRFVGGKPTFQKKESHLSLSCDGEQHRDAKRTHREANTTHRDAKTRVYLRRQTNGQLGSVAAQQMSTIKEQTDNSANVELCHISSKQKVSKVVRGTSDEDRILIGSDDSGNHLERNHMFPKQSFISFFGRLRKKMLTIAAGFISHPFYAACF
jgi:hypothetical protein